MRTYRGKIGNLPVKLRLELCERMLNGAQGPDVLPWLNGHPDVIAYLADKWDGKPIDADNLSQWRKGGFQDWYKETQLRDLAETSLRIAKASGGHLSEGSVAVLGGRVFGALESLFEDALADDQADADEDTSEGKPSKRGDRLRSLANTVAALRDAEIKSARLKLEAERHVIARQKHDLDREKFEVAIANKVLEAAKDPKIQAIVGASTDDSAKIAAIREHWFGQISAETQQMEVQA